MEACNMLTNLMLGFGNFMYFPEDKTEYIPAAISMSVFVLMAVAAFFFIKRVSKKEEQKTKHLEEQMSKMNQQNKG
jgi:large-conductance mechanosensitive channel